MRLTTLFIIANVVVFILQTISFNVYCDPAFVEADRCNAEMAHDPFTTLFSLTPALALGNLFIWQFFTYMFLHGNLWHISVNMIFLFMFGSAIEYSLGQKKYISLFVISGMGSALFYLLLTTLLTPGSALSTIPMMGASGAVFGILAAYGFMFPKNKVFLFFIEIPAIVLVGILAVVEFVIGLYGLQEGIANFGHLGGIISGILVMYYYKNKISKSRSGKSLREFEYFWE